VEDPMKIFYKQLRMLAALGLAGYASLTLAEVPVKAGNGLLTNTNGMTLYVFDKDTGGKSMCNGTCANNWPPLTAQSGAKAEGDYTTITRDDGSMQWAYKGKPLYTWVKDQKPGDQTGNGFNNVWHVATP
jgi:predicted lipoprotein with Yx(FWY)xxD motif